MISDGCFPLYSGNPLHSEYLLYSAVPCFPAHFSLCHRPLSAVSGIPLLSFSPLHPLLQKLLSYPPDRPSLPTPQPDPVLPCRSGRSPALLLASCWLWRFPDQSATSRPPDLFLPPPLPLPDPFYQKQEESALSLPCHPPAP